MISKCHTDTVQFVTVVRRNTKHKIVENTSIERKEIWKKKNKKKKKIIIIIIREIG